MDFKGHSYDDDAMGNILMEIHKLVFKIRNWQAIRTATTVCVCMHISGIMSA